VYAGGTVFYLALAVWAASLVFTGPDSKTDDQSARDWTAWLLAQPYGQWATIFVGACIIGAGVGSGWNAVRGKFAERFFAHRDPHDWMVWLGRFGFFARAVLFLIVGVFLVIAALHFNAGEARGLGGAFRVLQRQSYGWILLAITALGLFGFGAFQVTLALFRRVDAPDVDEAKAKVQRAVS
jgi:hypothetical protein